MSPPGTSSASSGEARPRVTLAHYTSTPVYRADLACVASRSVAPALLELGAILSVLLLKKRRW